MGKTSQFTGESQLFTQWQPCWTTVPFWEPQAMQAAPCRLSCEASFPSKWALFSFTEILALIFSSGFPPGVDFWISNARKIKRCFGKNVEGWDKSLINYQRAVHYDLFKKDKWRQGLPRKNVRDLQQHIPLRYCHEQRISGQLSWV